MSNIFDKIIDFLFDTRPLILVVGKDENNRRYCESIITGAGYRYTGRYRLEKGYDLTTLGNLELIIWDLNVGETTDYDIEYDIRRRYKIPILIFADDKHAMSAEKAISHHIEGYHDVVKIKKPVTTEQLLALISQYLCEQTSPLIKDTVDD